ncbi:MAG: hypothetical protein FJX89_03880 [Bacteroidetes bacterium]|nr:hypothetical protein [Bacteroidota bacterium]
MTQTTEHSHIVFEAEETEDIGFVESLCWRMLAEAARDRRSPMHTVVIGTGDGARAQLRTVIIRRVDEAEKRVYFHTDYRSGKVSEIRTSRQLAWLAYDASRRSQIRLTGPTLLHHKDELCQLHWASTKHSSRRCYLLPEGPGQPLGQPTDAIEERLSTFSYSMEESEAGFQHFAVVETSATELEWYYTHSRGNRRARFRYEAGQLVQSEWLTP